MYIWNALTGWICCHCCRNTESSDREPSGSNEETPLLDELGQNEQSRNSTNFTAGYTDYLHSSNALRLVLIHGITYYTLAVILYSCVLETRWSVIDSLYFATVLFTTIGYGDFSPASDVGRICTMGLALYGIVILGIFLGIYGEALLEHKESSEAEQQTTVRKTVVDAMVLKSNEAMSLRSSVHVAANGNGLRSSSASDTENGTVEDRARALGAESAPDDEPGSQEILDKIKQSRTTLTTDIGMLILAELPILTLVALIGIVIGHFEGWNLIESAYWTIISGTTVGFGDEAPQNAYVRLLCVVFLPLCVAVLGEILSRIADLYLSRKRRISQEEFFSRTLTKEDLATMDTDDDGSVSKGEFLAYMLVALQLVGKDDIDKINKLFNTLDRDKSGMLHQADLVLLNWDKSMTKSIADVALSPSFQDQMNAVAAGRRSQHRANSMRNVGSIWWDKTQSRRRASDIPWSRQTIGEQNENAAGLVISNDASGP